MKREKNTKQIILTTLVVVGGAFSAGGSRVTEDRTVQHAATAGIADLRGENNRYILGLISGLEGLLTKANESPRADPKFVEAINGKLTHLIEDFKTHITTETHEEKQPTTSLEKFNELMISASSTVALNGKSVLKMIKSLYDLGAFLPQIPFIVPYQRIDPATKNQLFEKLISLMSHDISDDTFQAFKEKVGKDWRSNLNLVCITNYISTLKDSLRNEKYPSQEFDKFFKNLVKFEEKYLRSDDEYTDDSTQATLKSLVATLCLQAYSTLEAISRENLQLGLNIPGALIAHVMDTIHSNLEQYQNRTVVKNYIKGNPGFAFKAPDSVSQAASAPLTKDNLGKHNSISIPRP